MYTVAEGRQRMGGTMGLSRTLSFVVCVALVTVASSTPFFDDVSEYTAQYPSVDWTASFTKEELESGGGGSASARIVNGDNVGRASMAPYVVSIYAIFNRQWYFVCTGAIVHKNVVITAAHCTFPGEKRKLGVCTESVRTPKSGRCLFVVGRRVPDKYLKTSLNSIERPMSHDVALLKTRKSMVGPFRSAKVISVDFNEAGPSRKGLIYGFGNQDIFSKVNDNKLKYADSAYRKFGLCVNDPRVRKRNFFCVDGNFDGTKATSCHGDSGGPLVESFGALDPRRHRLIGVASFVYGLSNSGEESTCSFEIPAGYARLSAIEIKGWLRRKIKELGGRFRAA